MKDNYLFLKQTIYFKYLERDYEFGINPIVVGFERCSPTKSPIRLFKNHYVLHYVLSGKGYFSVNGKTYTITAHTMFLIPPGIHISYYPDPREPWHYIWIETDGNLCHMAFNLAGFTDENYILESKSDEIENLFAELTEESMENRSGLTIGITAKFLSIIDLLAKQNKNTFSPKGLKNTVRKIVDFLEQNYFNASISIASIAAEFGYSVPYLSRLFKRETGMSPIKYLINIRMEKACVLLETKSYTITEIANAVGYNSSFYFTNTFKKIYGCPPSQYNTDAQKE